MYNNIDYPAGSDTPDAPWNQDPDVDCREVEIKLTLTISKTIKATTNDYTILSREKNEDGGCDEEIEYNRGAFDDSPEVIKALDNLNDGWDVDYMEIEPNE